MLQNCCFRKTLLKQRNTIFFNLGKYVPEFSVEDPSQRALIICWFLQIWIFHHQLSIILFNLYFQRAPNQKGHNELLSPKRTDVFEVRDLHVEDFSESVKLMFYITSCLLYYMYLICISSKPQARCRRELHDELLFNRGTDVSEARVLYRRSLPGGELLLEGVWLHALYRVMQWRYVFNVIYFCNN